MLKSFFLIAFTAVSSVSIAQSTYEDSLKNYIKDYVDKHEVIKGKDKNKLQFFPIDPTYRVVASFEKKDNSSWFLLPTSGPLKKLYRIYGVIHFTVNGTPAQLNIYQSQDLLQNAEYRDYLFLPFIDATTGNESYHGGRYIDLKMADIQNNEVVVDFNKAYNPYCAYVSGKYNCPIPPKENKLSIPIKAGEKTFE
jgi:hypothetical protein